MIVAADRRKLAWLLNENCFASIICVSFSSSSITQDSFIRKYFFVMGGDNSGKKRIMKTPWKNLTNDCSTRNWGSVLVFNVNEGTLKLYAPINSKLQHPAPRAYPGHLTVHRVQGGGNLNVALEGWGIWTGFISCSDVKRSWVFSVFAGFEGFTR